LPGDAGTGVYVTRRSRGRSGLHRRLTRARATARDLSLLSDLKRDATAVVFHQHIRGVDPFTGRRYEIRSVVIIPAATQIRPLTRAPGYVGPARR